MYFFTDLKITPIPMSEDNYAYHILDDTQKICVLVDPADPESVRVRNELHHCFFLFNPFTLRAAKIGLTILIILF